MVEKLIKRLDLVKEKGNYRNLSYYQRKFDKYIVYDDKKYINFASNDYLGLSVDNEILRRFYNTFKVDVNELGFSSVSSRLMSGNPEIYKILESELSEFFGKDRSIVYNSGYHMNVGVLPALTDKRDLILSDKLNHASIIDGMRLSEAKHFRYRHLDYEGLERYLNHHRADYENVFIVTESLFSMDGDIADIRKLVEIKNRYNCFLYVDEAHAVGVYGEGRGISYDQGVLNEVDILAGTFGKAFASVGGFILTNELFYELLVNFSRPLIFTTALPPVVLYWNLYILQNMKNYEDRRIKLFQLHQYMRNQFKKHSFKTLGESYIIPFITGDSKDAINLSKHLKENGIIAPAIRPPTVPEGGARIRFSLNANLDYEDIDRLISLLSGGINES